MIGHGRRAPRVKDPESRAGSVARSRVQIGLWRWRLPKVSENEL